MARGRYGSIYDSYNLSNSTAIPMFTGSAGPEMLKVGEYLQGIYNTAENNAVGIEGNLDQIQSLPQDRALAEELRSSTQTKLAEWAKRKDYENLLPDVQREGIKFANRYRELIAPMQARAEYQKALENKDLNLTSTQKAGLLGMSDAGYKGLQQVAPGKYQGQYVGERADTNIDINKWVDERIKDIAVQKGGVGSEVVQDNGEWKMRRAGSTKWEHLNPGTIENTLSASAKNDPKVQAWMDMQGRITGFQGSRINANSLPEGVVKEEIFAISKKYGIPLSEASRVVYDRAERSRIGEDILKYAKNKYAFNNVFRESSRGDEMGEVQTDRLKKANDASNNSNNIFGDLVTGQGIDLSTKYGSAGDLETKLRDANTNLEATNTYLDGQRHRVARALGLKNKATDAQVEQWYAQNDVEELSRFQANKNSIGAINSSMREMNQVKDAAMDEAVKKATGGQQTFKELKTAATKQFQDAITKSNLTLGSKKGFTLPSLSGGTSTTTGDVITPTTVKNWEVVDTQNGFGGAQTWIKVRNKDTGKEQTITLGGSGGPNTIDAGYGNKDLNKVAGIFDNISWKNAYKTGTQGLRTNMVWMPLLNKTTPDGELTKAGAYMTRAQGLISAAAASNAIKVRDNNDTELKSDDSNQIRTLVAAGKYRLLGIGVDPNTGERRMSVSVEVDKDASDVADRYKTVMLGADTNFWDNISSSLKNAAAKDINSSDQAARAAALKTLQFGLGLQTGSGYQAVGKRLPGQVDYIKDAEGNTVFEIRHSATGNAGNSITHQVFPVTNGKRGAEAVSFNDALDLGAYIDVLRSQGKTLTTE